MADRLADAALEAAALARIVQGYFGRGEAELDRWECRPLRYAQVSPTSGGLYRVAGAARVDGIPQPWSLILKTVREPEDGPGLAPDHYQYWKRELLAYRSGLLDDLPGELAAPRCYGAGELP